MRAREAKFAVQAVVFDHEVPLKTARTNAQKRGAIAMFGIHIGLKLKNISAEGGLNGINDDLAVGRVGQSRSRRRSHIQEGIKKGLHAKIGQGRGEKNGSYFTLEE